MGCTQLAPPARAGFSLSILLAQRIEVTAEPGTPTAAVAGAPGAVAPEFVPFLPTDVSGSFHGESLRPVSGRARGSLDPGQGALSHPVTPDSSPTRNASLRHSTLKRRGGGSMFRGRPKEPRF